MNIKKGDKVSIEGLNIAPDGKMYFNKLSKRKNKKPPQKLNVIDVISGEPEIKPIASHYAIIKSVSREEAEKMWPRG